MRKIVNECHDKAKEVISDHKEELIRIANALMEYETLTAEQIQKVVKGEPIEDTPADKPADQPAEATA